MESDLGSVASDLRLGVDFDQTLCLHCLPMSIFGTLGINGSTFLSIITKTCLFKYTENFTTKNENFQIKNLIFFMFLLKT